MTKYKIIVNPIAGRGAGEKSIPLIKGLLQDYGLDFDLVRTECPWHAAELAQQAVSDGYEVVVAVGGDGTANEVLNGLMQAKQAGRSTATMGFINVGRGNDFGFGVGVPKGVAAGCKVLQQGYRRVIDIGRVAGGLYPQGRYFGNGVGIGFDAVVGFEAVKMKHLTGFLNYLVAALKTIFLYYRAPLVKIEYNEEAITQLSLMVSIMNGRRMGGAFMMAPHSEIDDGFFDICIASQTSRARIFALIPQFMKGTQASQPEIKMARTKRISVTALEGVLPAHADGETLCTDGKCLTVELLPRQLEIICQAAEATL